MSQQEGVDCNKLNSLKTWIIHIIYTIAYSIIYFVIGRKCLHSYPYPIHIIHIISHLTSGLHS